MRALSRAIDRFCLKHRDFGIPKLMNYIVFISAAVYLIILLDKTEILYYLLAYDTVLIFQYGQVWRLMTWLFLPVGTNPFFVVLALYFYYFVGSTLEREWGTAKFTLYYIFGVILNIIYGIVMWVILRGSFLIEPHYLNLSLFFAFAVYFPDYTLMLFLFIPVKAKWIALVNAAFFAFEIVSNTIAGHLVLALTPVIALLNFFIFCVDELLSYLRPLKAKTNPQAINFKRAAKKAKRTQSHNPYRYKCSVCGLTDIDDPGMEFRYCSRCAGYHCFCSEHINNHIHFST